MFAHVCSSARRSAAAAAAAWRAQRLSSASADAQLAGVAARTRNGTDLVKRVSHVRATLFLQGVAQRTRVLPDVGVAPLNVGEVVACARFGAAAHLTRDASVRERLNASVAYLRGLVAGGGDVYGVTTGFGGSADVHTSATERLQHELVRFLNASAGEPLLPEEDVRASMLARVNANAIGLSALRASIMERILDLLNANVTAAMPARGSITASGDLVPLSYLAALVEGAEHAKARVRTSSSTEMVPVREALRRAGFRDGGITLREKEALALVNGTSVAVGAGATCVYDANALFLVAQVTTALTVEAMLGTNQSFHPLIHDVAKPHRGQVEVARNVLGLLRGSSLARDEQVHESGHAEEIGQLRQDRYALRTAAQWLGPVAEVLLDTTERLSIELNSATDNPLVCGERQLVLHGGNFQGAAIGLGFDAARLAMQSVGRLVHAQFSELVNPHYNNGLPANLAGADPVCCFGAKGMDIAMSAYMSELEHLANPVTNHVQSAELHNQDVNSLGLLSVRRTRDALSVLEAMLAQQLVALVQAVDLRAQEKRLADAFEHVLHDCLGPFARAAGGLDVLARHVHRVRLSQPTGALPWHRAGYSEAAQQHLCDVVVLAVERYAVGVGGGAGGGSGVSLSSNDITVHEWAKQARDLRAALLQSMEARFGAALAAPPAPSESAAQLSPRTAGVYRFVRETLGIAFDDGTLPPGPAIERVVGSMRDGSLFGAVSHALAPLLADEPDQ